MDRFQSTPAVDLSAATVRALGRAFANAFDSIDRNTQRDEHAAGLVLAHELQRAGLSVSRPPRLLSLDTVRMFGPRDPSIDAPARARASWLDDEEDDPLAQTAELEAPSFLDMGAGE